MYRLHPQQTRVLELLRSGAIGEVVFVRASFCFFMPRERRRQDVRLRKDLQGGALMDVGCYSVNLARLIMGDEPLEVHGQQHIDPEFGVDSLAPCCIPRQPPGAGGRCFVAPGPGGYEVTEHQASRWSGPARLVMTHGSR
jgi:predicted dehydrogenase